MVLLRAFKEITKWDDNTPNHTYILNEQGHLVGYRKTSTKEYIQFKSPMKQFSKTRRKFIELKPVEKYMGLQND
jgi:hypothetical protein